MLLKFISISDLEEWSLDLLQVGHPEALLPPGDEGSPDGVLEDLVDPEVGQHRGLVVGESQLVGNASRLVGHHQVRFARRTHKWTAVPEEPKVLLVTIHVPNTQN